MYRVALCEDEKLFSEAQEKICRDILNKLNIEHHISVFETSAAFWAAFSKGNRYDLMLMDIVMDETDGMELARQIRKQDCDGAIIFITASPEYALRGYDVNALHYLLKPLDGEMLEKLIVSDYERRFRRSFLVVKSGTQTLRIPTKDIIALETMGRRVVITTAEGTVEYSGKLSELSEELSKEHFIRCHVGYIINLKNIQRLNRTEAIASNGKIIPVSRAYSGEVQKAFLKQMWQL
jgi:DNA-binding LytR/AlgR family response regulator